MRWSVILFILITLGFFPACNSNSNQGFREIREAVKIVGDDLITIDIGAGEVMISSADEMDLSVYGQVFSPDAFEIVWEGAELNILHGNSNRSDQYQIHVPHGIHLVIKTFSANLILKDLSGELEIRSTGGNVQLVNFDGSAQIWSGRGDVTILNGIGDAVIIGEHGKLTAKNFTGMLSMSSIMGSIEYDAPLNMNDFVRLETDHGPISVYLHGDADVDVQVSTTSGSVICAGAELSQTVNGCAGLLGDGSGELFIRTVSGGVKLTVDNELTVE